MFLGRDPNAPVEVIEAAKDIVKRIQERAREIESQMETEEVVAEE